MRRGEYWIGHLHSKDAEVGALGSLGSTEHSFSQCSPKGQRKRPRDEKEGGGWGLQANMALKISKASELLELRMIEIRPMMLLILLNKCQDWFCRWRETGSCSYPLVGKHASPSWAGFACSYKGFLLIFHTHLLGQPLLQV